ncbi:MAG: carboxypeptidase regulatory-like domain-containing protein [Planctomycetota bacterium]|nr:carboxypeptidase regulatory-like domain-containing protein [Planctomycetota bacterium]
MLEEGTRKPIANAVVYLLFSEGLDGDGQWQHTRTGRQGGFRFRKITSGSWVLLTMHRDYVARSLGDYETLDRDGRTAFVDSITLHAPAQTGGEPRVLLMRAAKGRQGRVIDEAKRPVPGAHVVIDLSSYQMASALGASMYFPEDRPVAIADAEGRFRLPAMPEGLAEVDIAAYTPQHAGIERSDLDLDDGTDEIVLVVKQVATLSGHVQYADGRPAAGLSIYLSTPLSVLDHEESPRTDAEGNFELTRVPPGTTELDFYIEDPWLELEDHEIPEVQPGETRTGLTFTIQAGKLIQGRLVDKAGLPLADQDLDLRHDQPGTSDHGDWADSTQTDADGTFSLTTLLEGPFLLFHDRGDAEFLLKDRIMPDGVPLVLVGERYTPTVITVRVVDSAGEPVPRFLLHGSGMIVDWEDDEIARDFDEVLGEGGRVRLPLVGKAPWNLIVHGARRLDGLPLDAGTGHATLAALPTEPVVITLPPAGSVEVAFEDEAGVPVPGVTMVVEPEDGLLETISPARFRIHGISRLDDSIGVEIRVPAGFVRRDTLWIDPDDGDRTIVLRRGQRLAGRVTCPLALGPADFAAIHLQAEWWGQENGERDGADILVGPDGRFELTGVPPVDNIWIGEHEDHEFPRDLYLTSSVKAKLGDTEVIVPLEAGAGLQVHLTGAGEGRLRLVDAIIGVIPVADRLAGRVVEWGSPDEDGHVRFRSLPPGAYDVVLFNTDIESILASRAAVPTGTDLRIPLPAVASIDITVEAVAPTHFARIMTWCAAAPDAMGRMEGESMRPEGALPADVQLSLDKLAAGERYTFMAVEYDDSSTLTRAGVVTGVRPGGEGAVIRLAPVVMITGRVEGESEDDDFEVAVATPHLRRHVSRAGNDFRIALPPGRYDVLLLDPTGKTVARIDGVTAGGHDPLVLRAPSKTR